MDKTHTFFTILLCAVLAAFLWAACVVSAGAELPRTQRTMQGLKAAPGVRLHAFQQSGSTQEIKPSAPATPEVTQLRPDCAAGGGKAIEIVLAGNNFPGPFPSVKSPRQKAFPRIECQRKEGEDFFSLKVESVTFESPTRAVARVLIPESAENAHCELTLVAERVRFEILNPAQPMEVKALFIVEGNLSGEDLLDRQTAKLDADPMSAFAPGLLSAAPSSIKFVQGDKTLFDKPASSLKAVEDPMHLHGLEGTYFRIVFNDGKVYNFQGVDKALVCDGGEYTEVSAYQALKKKFSK